MKRADIVDLTNKHLHIKDDLWLVGIDDELAGTPKIDTVEGIPENRKNISIFSFTGIVQFHKS